MSNREVVLSLVLLVTLAASIPVVMALNEDMQTETTPNIADLDSPVFGESIKVTYDVITGIIDSLEGVFNGEPVKLP